MQIEQQGPGAGSRGGMGSRVRDFFLRALALIAGAGLVVGAFVISIVFFAVVFAVAVVAVGYLLWRTRHLRKQMRQRAQQGDVIEGEVLKSE